MVARPMPRLPSMRSTSTRLKISPQRSSSPMRMPAACAARANRSRSGSPSGSVANRSMPAKRANASATVSRSGAANGSAARPRNVKLAGPGRLRRRAPGSRRSPPSACRYGSPARYHSTRVNSGMMQRAALAVAEHLCEFDDAALAGREQLFAGEFRRGAQIERRRRAVRRRQRRRKGMQMGLVSGRHLQCAGLDLDEILAANQARSAATMRFRASSTGRRSAWTCGAQKGEERAARAGMSGIVFVCGRMRK